MRMARLKDGILSQDTTITFGHRHPLYLCCYISILIFFYESGKVKERIFSTGNNRHLPDGIPYTFAASGYIGFYESGKVEYGALAKQKTLTIDGNGYTFERGIVSMHSDTVEFGSPAKRHPLYYLLLIQLYLCMDWVL